MAGQARRGTLARSICDYLECGGVLIYASAELSAVMFGL